MSDSIAKKVAAAMLAAAASQTALATPAITPSNPAPAAQLASSKASCATKMKGLTKVTRERCFGIVRKGMNDCGTSRHACASQATTNSDPSEWIFVAKGNCNRIVNSSLQPPAKNKKK